MLPELYQRVCSHNTINNLGEVGGWGGVAMADGDNADSLRSELTHRCVCVHVR